MNTSKNLRLLADHIERNVDQSQIDMSIFKRHGNKPVDWMLDDECGTVGCALGHAPCVEELKPIKSDFVKYSEVSPTILVWNVYGARVFPGLYHVLRIGGEGQYNGFDKVTELDHWHDVFSEELSSNKAEVVARLRYKAIELDELRNV